MAFVVLTSNYFTFFSICWHVFCCCSLFLFSFILAPEINFGPSDLVIDKLQITNTETNELLNIPREKSYYSIRKYKWLFWYYRQTILLSFQFVGTFFVVARFSFIRLFWLQKLTSALLTL